MIKIELLNVKYHDRMVGGYPVADTQSGSVWFVFLQENVEWTKWMIAFWEKHAIFVAVIKFDY